MPFSDLAFLVNNDILTCRRGGWLYSIAVTAARPGPWRGGQRGPGAPPDRCISQIIRGQEGVVTGHGLPRGLRAGGWRAPPGWAVSQAPGEEQRVVSLCPEDEWRPVGAWVRTAVLPSVWVTCSVRAPRHRGPRAPPSAPRALRWSRPRRRDPRGSRGPSGCWSSPKAGDRDPRARGPYWAGLLRVDGCTADTWRPTAPPENFVGKPGRGRGHGQQGSRRVTPQEGHSSQVLGDK